MKKRFFGKVVILLMSTVICFTGCASNKQETNTRFDAFGATNDNEDASREDSADDNLFTNLEINSMTVSFYNGYNYSTVEAINESGSMTLEEYTVNLNADQIERVQSTLSDIEVFPYEECDGLVAVPDYYKICINGSLEILCSSFRYIAVEEPLTMFNAEDFIQEIENICDEYLEANVSLKLFDEGVDFIICNGKSIDINSELLDDLNQFTFSKVDINDKYEEYGTVESTIALSNGAVLLLFDGDNKFGYIDGTDYNCFVMMGEYMSYSLPEFLENVSNNRDKNLGASDNASVTLSYNGKELAADNVISSEEVEDIIKYSRIMYYASYDWLNKDYEIEESVCIDIGNGCFYIPVNKTYGNRYYVDSEGNKYLVNSFGGEIEYSIFNAFEIDR